MARDRLARLDLLRALLIHPELCDDVLFTDQIDSGRVDAAFSAADRTIQVELMTDQHAAVLLQTCGVVAEFNRADLFARGYDANRSNSGAHP